MEYSCRRFDVGYYLCFLLHDSENHLLAHLHLENRTFVAHLLEELSDADEEYPEKFATLQD
jgi:hypothetical protein